MTNATQQRHEGHTMKFQLVDQPGIRIPQDIMLDGKKIGEIKPMDDGRHHAALYVPGGDSVSAGLAQGFGRTEDEAIQDALTAGEKDGRAYLTGVAQLQALLGFIDGKEAQ
ncbi:hypothetical protein RE428_07670 [Marinobacter nanhaiticus D15-8W]|uniref:Uncharacterized protein n=1 Tax=Marinobacter nanhaiticus D15-8W TaxID=626887 RepID=N6VWH9_9GAMM|nr:hypothetical protein [Marinobacter nanhaiticus]ENO14610.1 hypothetical protein J057_04646 [Marinobacter nanhaiticus D15-8W]BES69704.1 hypothetical protein RE428_07220 [Marinobacter nanhaiticus D15-8W]BES69749.1 hypothetical protein RE428_07670 [Marinobacter nanhaiticus D15-8W]